MPDNDRDTIALQEAYANLYNEIVKPDRVFVATQYFRKKWVPRLGTSLAWVIIDAKTLFINCPKVFIALDLGQYSNFQK